MKHQSHGAVTGLGIIRPIREIRVPGVDSSRCDPRNSADRITKDRRGSAAGYFQLRSRGVVQSGSGGADPGGTHGVNVVVELVERFL